jgi:hypothetical protein
MGRRNRFLRATAMPIDGCSLPDRTDEDLVVRNGRHVADAIETKKLSNAAWAHEWPLSSSKSCSGFSAAQCRARTAC